MAAKVDYDYKKAYGKPCKIRAGQIGGVCDDYADFALNAFKEAINKDLFDAKALYKVSGMNHAWCEIVMPDGRTVYVDPTWFDINKIGDDGYSISTPQEIGLDWDYLNITYDKDLISHGYSGKKRSQ